MKAHRFMSIERPARRFPSEAARVLLFVAGPEHRRVHIKASNGLHSPPTSANGKHVFVQRRRLRRQRRQMLVTQLALPLCAAAAFRHSQGCYCYALTMQTIAKVARLEGRFALLRVRPNPSIEGMPKRLRLLCTPHVKR